MERFPERCGVARERRYLEEDLRQLVFKSHRIVFQIEKRNRTVYVLYVRHANRRAVGETRTEREQTRAAEVYRYSPMANRILRAALV